ncbi:creatininase family protein [Tenggerimyces flavus]|uniref:Creatininase family protein n=1 Tax=Tenggerimyces flavus TaxID=1708749 RepID=A0ABV7Y694_9ACTN|nr:creatininase family protein [Tenggerimyces flavus]MBM7788527.1 creatinine amidohydrolase [Tenggerimyces flavus]
MTVLRWVEQTRETLNEILPEALVLLPIGATEQHGPYLPTGTDHLMAQEVVERAAALAGAKQDVGRPLVIAPTVATGASDHHLPFGGTLSLQPETLHLVLLDLARSISACGGRRLVIVNGHGGNHGVAHAAGAAASNRYDLNVATTDYWQLLPSDATEGTNTPGHAGAFEASLVLATYPDLVKERPTRERVPDTIPETLDGFVLHSKAIWHDMEGYTDDPSHADAANGEAWLAAIAGNLADKLVHLAKTL